MRPDGAASLTCPHWRVGVRRPCQQLTPRGTFAWRAGGSRRGGVPRSVDLGLPRPCWAQHFRSKQREDRSSGHRAPGRPPLAAGSAGAGTRPQPAPEPRTASAFVSGKWPSLSLPPTRPVSTPSAPAASLLRCDPPGGGSSPCGPRALVSWALLGAGGPGVLRTEDTGGPVCSLELPLCAVCLRDAEEAARRAARGAAWGRWHGPRQNRPCRDGRGCFWPTHLPGVRVALRPWVGRAPWRLRAASKRLSVRTGRHASQRIKSLLTTEILSQHACWPASEGGSPSPVCAVLGVPCVEFRGVSSR